MFSATMPPKIQKLARSVLDNPVEIKIAVSRPTEKIDQRAYICPERGKTALLLHVFDTVSSERVIVFASSKLKVKELARELRRKKLLVGEMHSDLDQKARDAVMHAFRNNHTNILVATDIVARGIDIDDISMVVNYDVPHDAEDYVHRIGRTARAGAGGVAVTLVGERDRRKFKFIEDFLGYKVTRGDMPEDASRNTEATETDNDVEREQKSKPRRGKGRRDKVRRERKRPEGITADKDTSLAGENTSSVSQQAKEASSERSVDTASKQGPAVSPEGENSSPKPRKKRRYYHRPKKKSNPPTND